MTNVTTGMPAGVFVTQVDAKDGNDARVRAHYVSADYIVRVDVSGKDLASTLKNFNDLLSAQLKALPANG
jgi:hypothetical protein